MGYPRHSEDRKAMVTTNLPITTVTLPAPGEYLSCADMLLDCLIFSRDQKLISTIQWAGSNGGITPKLCSGATQVSALLGRTKFYALVVDDADLLAATEVLNAARKSPSSRSAISIAVVGGSAGGTLGATFVLRKPVAGELILKTFRAAQGTMMKEYQRYCRHNLEAPVIVTTAAGQELHATANNISQGGVGISLTPSDLVTPQATVRLKLALPPKGSCVELSGAVAWRRGDRLGIQCQGVSLADRKQWDEWLAARFGQAKTVS